MTTSPDRLLLGAALLHGLVAVVCAALLLVDAVPILGVHPAEKPLKFAISIALFLGSMAFLVPSLSAAPATKTAFAAALSATMTTEMVVIAIQALRGRRSHFNLELPSDVAVVIIMFVGIAILVPVMISVAGIAMTRPLRTGDGVGVPALDTWAWRAALGLFFVAIVSGVAMGSRARHTVGSDDGGAGMMLTNWSSAHGDLRVSHFFALHALQIIPLAAVVIAHLPLGRVMRGGLLAMVIVGNAALVVWSLVVALAGRPFFEP